MKAAYASLKSSAKERGIEFAISLEYFSAFAIRTKLLTGRGRSRDAWHVDRIDNSKGYVEGNLQVLTASENVSKENQRRKTCKAVDQRNQMLEAGWPFFIPQSSSVERSFVDEPVALDTAGQEKADAVVLHREGDAVRPISQGQPDEGRA